MVQVISEEQEKMGGFRGGRGGGGRGGFRGGRDGGWLGLSNQDIYHQVKSTHCIMQVASEEAEGVGVAAEVGPVVEEEVMVMVATMSRTPWLFQATR